METQDKPVQIVYEGSRSFSNYEITVDVTVINLFKFGMYEVLIRDHESQCAIAPIYLRSPIIKENIRQNLANKRTINAGQSNYLQEAADDDDDFKLSVYNYIADRLTIKRRPVTSADQYVIEYVPLVNDPKHKQEKKVVCDGPYSPNEPVSECEEMLLIPKVFKSVVNRNTFAGAVLRSIGFPLHAFRQLVLRYRSERVVVPINSSDNSTVLVGPSTSAVLSSAAATARRDPDSSGGSSQRQFSPLRGSSEDVSNRAVKHLLKEQEDGDAQTHCDSKKLIEYNLFHLNAMPDNTGALLNSEVFLPHMKIPKHKSIEELCDPKVIERIPDRQHVFEPQPSFIRGMLVDVTGDFEEYESSKTQHYNEGTPFNSLPFITAEEMASLIRGDRRTLPDEYNKKEANLLLSERLVSSHPLAAEGTPDHHHHQQQQQSTTRDGV